MSINIPSLWDSFVRNQIFVVYKYPVHSFVRNQIFVVYKYPVPMRQFR